MKWHIKCLTITLKLPWESFENDLLSISEGFCKVLAFILWPVLFLKLSALILAKVFYKLSNIIKFNHIFLSSLLYKVVRTDHAKCPQRAKVLFYF